jgi:hypothetical protein
MALGARLVGGWSRDQILLDSKPLRHATLKYEGVSKRFRTKSIDNETRLQQ